MQLTYPRTGFPALRARDTTGAMRASTSSTDPFVLRVLNPSVAETKTDTLSTRASSASSSPRSFGTSAE